MVHVYVGACVMVHILLCVRALLWWRSREEKGVSLCKWWLWALRTSSSFGSRFCAKMETRRYFLSLSVCVCLPFPPSSPPVSKQILSLSLPFSLETTSLETLSLSPSLSLSLSPLLSLSSSRKESPLPLVTTSRSLETTSLYPVVVPAPLRGVFSCVWSTEYVRVNLLCSTLGTAESRGKGASRPRVRCSFRVLILRESITI